MSTLGLPRPPHAMTAGNYLPIIASAGVFGSAAAGGEEGYLDVGATMAMSERFYVGGAPGAPGATHLPALFASRGGRSYQAPPNLGKAPSTGVSKMSGSPDTGGFSLGDRVTVDGYAGTGTVRFVGLHHDDGNTNHRQGSSGRGRV